MSKPKILLIPDREGWAFDIRCTALMEHLSCFEFKKMYFNRMKEIDYKQFDLVYYAGFYMIGGPQDKAWKVIDRKKTVTSISGLVTKTFEDALQQLAKVSAYSALNYEFAEWFDGVVEAKMFYIPNGVEEELFTPGSKAESDELIVGWVGKDDHKGKRLEKLREVVDSIPGVKLITQTFSNYIPHKEMPKFYKQLDCYCQPSVSEGCCNPMLEAAACGIPIISTPVGVARELLQRDGGIIINPDLVGLKATIIGMKEKDRRGRMSKVLRNRILDGWTWKHRAMQYKDMFEYALEAGEK